MLVTTPALAGNLGDVGMQRARGGFRPASAVDEGPRRRPWSRAGTTTSPFSSSRLEPQAKQSRRADPCRHCVERPALADAFALTADDVQLAAAPLSHVLGMSGVMNASLITGGAVALMERFEASAAFSLLASAGITGVVGAPPMFVALLREAQKAGLCRGYVSQWRAAPRWRRRSRALWKRRFSARCARLRHERSRRWDLGRVGAAPAKAAFGRARISGERVSESSIRHRRAPADRRRGEVPLTSRSVMRGYRSRSKKAPRRWSIPDGWLLTGYIAYLDPRATCSWSTGKRT